MEGDVFIGVTLMADPMRIAFITGNYPSSSQPANGTFVQQFVWAMAREGNDCIVVRPTSIFDARHGVLPPEEATEEVSGGRRVLVLRPRYISFSSKDLGWTHTGRWTQETFNAAVQAALMSLEEKPDLVYGHFLYQAGFAAVSAGTRLNVPSVVGVGEGTFWTVEAFGLERARIDFADAAGFIAVGTHIRNGLVNEIGVPVRKITVQPNGVDLNRFGKMDRLKARKELNLECEAPEFLVAFVGTFDDLKGGLELVEATKGMPEVGLLLIGQGPLDLNSDRIVFKGRVVHEAVPFWLNAADIFVLPTREEGSCNAVVEAMACGLPIITADGGHMDDLVNDEVAIRVDPMSVEQIRAAIVTMKENPVLREEMSQACLERAKELGIDERARRVTAWMGKLIRGEAR